ncbi:2629_t:CDS:2 [Entrophospora sp. SA101]|nr:2629_t:CDS:2 [Entrophospora sp. SA101]
MSLRLKNLSKRKQINNVAEATIPKIIHDVDANMQEEIVVTRNKAIYELGEFYGIEREMVDNTIAEEEEAVASIDIALNNFIDILKDRSNVDDTEAFDVVEPIWNWSEL